MSPEGIVAPHPGQQFSTVGAGVSCCSDLGGAGRDAEVADGDRSAGWKMGRRWPAGAGGGAQRGLVFNETGTLVLRKSEKQEADV